MKTQDGRDQLRLLSARQLYEIIGQGKTWPAFRIWIYRLARRGELVPVRTSGHSVAWRAAEVQAWVESRPRAGRLQEIEKKLTAPDDKSAER